jgi:hypothetical protein
MNPNAFLLLNLAFGFYNVGTIWAHEIDIFRSWKLLDPKGFHEVQCVHWHKLPYWIFTPVGMSVLGSIALIWYHPSNSPLWGIGGVLLCQVLSIVLTAVYWGRWQAQLAQDPQGRCPAGDRARDMARLTRAGTPPKLKLPWAAWVLLGGNPTLAAKARRFATGGEKGIENALFRVRQIASIQCRHLTKGSLRIIHL